MREYVKVTTENGQQEIRELDSNEQKRYSSNSQAI